ncbi:hypothetical protein Nepgr_033796 [Nepenthes gracilis]|uniref:Uncharacterized protein n=1 Tax=Nepenthes gracilis TaxID=150966 RepID=A0AAD3TN18_NEPGR|nr:hypothetical protein Nepgr_033796 [Nepenthes gracilis]
MKQRNRQQLPSIVATGSYTIPTSATKPGNRRIQDSTSFSNSAKGIFKSSIGLFSSTLRPTSIATEEDTGTKNFNTGTIMLKSAAGHYGQQGAASAKS